MQVVQSPQALREAVAQLRQKGKVAFVPTMGNLHDGHLQLISAALEQADAVVASIFVNPMQFGQGEDFEKYPRTHQQDIDKLTAAGCDLLFLPEVKTIYPVPMEQHTKVEVPGISNILCGESRPGHFVGVATIVCKLFNLVMPDLAVFGEKDFQQLMVIRLMVRDLCMPLDIVGVPIVREVDGLAMSSRNGYLNQAQRASASMLYKQLQHLAEQVKQPGVDFSRLEQQFTDEMNNNGFETDYIAIRRQQDLQHPQSSDNQLVILAAAKLGNTRLIDNLLVNI